MVLLSTLFSAVPAPDGTFAIQKQTRYALLAIRIYPKMVGLTVKSCVFFAKNDASTIAVGDSTAMVTKQP